jgi:hypothetical protein
MMTTSTKQVKAELDEERDHYRNRIIPPEKLKIMDTATEELIASGLKDSVLKEGDPLTISFSQNCTGSPPKSSRS